MKYNNRFFVLKLNEEFSLRQKRNPSYSIRAYARDLDIARSTLFEVLKGRRPIPLAKIQNLLLILPLSPSEKTFFTESLYRAKVKLDDIEICEESITGRELIEDSHYKTISEWEHYAVLSLINTNDFKSSINFISKRLGISEERSKSVINNLKIAGFIEEKKHKYIRISKRLTTTEDIPSETIRNAHLEVLDLAKQKLCSTNILDRDYSTVTVSVDSRKIPEVKSIIREFRKKIIALLENGTKDEVFQVSIQMYPLTKINQKAQQ